LSTSLETNQVSAYDFCHEGTQYTLIDTPGFDDTSRPDSEITEAILTWCRDSLVSGQQLNGVIYIHRISAPRMAGSALRNVRIFRKLVGEDAFSSVVLATTFWEQVEDTVAEDREAELQANHNFWGAMTERGARMVRLHHNNRAEGLELLRDIAAKTKVVLKAQDELVNQGKAITETDAAIEQKKQQELFERELEAQRQAEKERMEKEAEEQARRAREKQCEVQRELERKLKEEQEASERARLQAEQVARESYERQQRQLAEERRRQEEWRRWEMAELERKRREELERQRKWKEDMERRQRAQEEQQRREREALRREHQRNCSKKYRPKWPCDSCKGDVTRKTYYYREFP
jgi:hypothetical protein